MTTTGNRPGRGLLTDHGEDPGRRGLSVVGHGGHPERVRGLGDDGGHGDAGGRRRRGDDGRRREGDYAGQRDVVHHQGVVAVVEGTQVAADTEALFCKAQKKKKQTNWLGPQT